MSMFRISLLFRKQRGKCFYCRAPTWIPSSRHKRQFSETAAEARVRLRIAPFRDWSAKKILLFSTATVEHLHRVADGGKRADGIVMACMFCNSTRHDASVEEHQAATAWLVMRGEHPVNRSAQMAIRPQVVAA